MWVKSRCWIISTPPEAIQAESKMQIYWRHLSLLLAIVTCSYVVSSEYRCLMNSGEKWRNVMCSHAASFTDCRDETDWPRVFLFFFALHFSYLDYIWFFFFLKHKMPSYVPFIVLSCNADIWFALKASPKIFSFSRNCVISSSCSCLNQPISQICNHALSHEGPVPLCSLCKIWNNKNLTLSSLLERSTYFPWWCFLLFCAVFLLPLTLQMLVQSCPVSLQTTNKIILIFGFHGVCSPLLDHLQVCTYTSLKLQ